MTEEEDEGISEERLETGISEVAEETGSIEEEGATLEVICFEEREEGSLEGCCELIGASLEGIADEEGDELGGRVETLLGALSWLWGTKEEESSGLTEEAAEDCSPKLKAQELSKRPDRPSTKREGFIRRLLRNVLGRL